MRLVMACVMVFAVGCGTTAAQSPPATAPASSLGDEPLPFEPAADAAGVSPERRNRGVFVGKSEEIDRSGRRFTAEEHPYAYTARLVSGGSHCEESVGFTFANVKSLGLHGQDCRFKVNQTSDGAATVWEALCKMQSRDVDVVVQQAMIIASADEIAPGGNGVPFRRVIFLSKTGIPGDSESLTDCRYEGAMVERRYANAR